MEFIFIIIKIISIKIKTGEYLEDKEIKLWMDLWTLGLRH
jgi:hypothetical protein